MPLKSRVKKLPVSLDAREETTHTKEQPKSNNEETPLPGTKQKNKGGRPAFNPTGEQRGMVKTLAMVGLSRQRIAEAIGIDSDTLAKHFFQELRDGPILLLARAMTESFNGMGAPKPETRLAASHYVLDRKGKDYGWTPRTENALRRIIYSGFDPSQLNSDDLAQLLQLMLKAGANIEPSDIPQVKLPDLKPSKPK